MLRIIGRKRLWLSLGIGMFGWALLAWPRAAAAGISRGLSACSGMILPSLFPFLVLGNFSVYSGAAAAVGRRLSSPTRVLFGLPGCAAPAILIALIGGYPAGANAVAALHKNGDISREDARHLLRFCVCGGPGYIVSAVGANLMGDTRFGWILFAANTLAALLIGIVYAPSRAKPKQARQMRLSPPLSPAAALVKAVTASCESALYMCGFILLFSALLSLADAVGLTALFGEAAVLLPCILEVSSGCIAVADNTCAPLLLGFALGFGGLSVHCQVAAAARDVDLTGFFVGRLVHGALGSLLTYGLCRLIPRSLPVFGIGDAALARPLFDSLPLSAALFLLCGIWMLTVADHQRAS